MKSQWYSLFLIISCFFFEACTITATITDMNESKSGSKSSPSGVMDTVAPSFSPGSINDGTSYASLSQSPNISWPSATDTDGSGIQKYQVAIGNTYGGTEVLDWTDVGNVTNYQISSLSLIDTTVYYPSVRAIDNAGNISSVILGDGWLVMLSGWQSQAYLKAANAEAGDIFGSSIAISGDTIVVGASLEDSNQTTITNGVTASGDNSATEAGAVYVYKRTGITWTQEAYLKAPNTDANDGFGASVSIDSDTIVVGAYGEGSNQTTITNGSTASSDNSLPRVGAIYVFKRTGVSWAQEAYIKAPNANANDWFGIAVAISGDTIVVGAEGESSNQTTISNGTTASSNNSALSSGAAYIFKRTGVTWAQEAYIKAPNANAGYYFGMSVAISGDTVVVGSSMEASNQTTITNGTTASSDNSASDSGAAYVFKRTGVTWAQEAYIKAPNAESNDYFGRSLAISGDTIVIGAVWEDSNQNTITNGTMASNDNSALDSGAAYVFKRTGVNWAQEAYLKASNAEADDRFGSSVAISGDRIVVGAEQEASYQTTITNGATASSDNSGAWVGAVYVFERTSINWAQVAYIKAPNADDSDLFGGSVAIDGSSIVVGAYQEASNQTTITNGATASSDNSAFAAGATYVFTK